MKKLFLNICTLSLTLLIAHDIHTSDFATASTDLTSDKSSSNTLPQAGIPRAIPSLFTGMLRNFARGNFFEQLANVRKENPHITDPRKLINAALDNLRNDDPEAHAFRNSFGLSIQELIDHKLLPTIIGGPFTGLTLHLSDMYIDDLTGIQNISGIQDIVVLYLDNNQLQTIIPGTFAGLTNLQQLNLDNNQLQTIQPGTFAGLTNLQELDLENNQLQTILPGAFVGLNNLKWLYLDDNELQAIKPDVFAGLDKLQELNLRNNQITTSERAGIATAVKAVSPNVQIIFGKNQ